MLGFNSTDTSYSCNSDSNLRKYVNEYPFLKQTLTWHCGISAYFYWYSSISGHQKYLCVNLEKYVFNESGINQIVKQGNINLHKTV